MLIKTARVGPLLERDPSSRSPLYPERLRLPGGRAVLLRPIYPEDADAEQALGLGRALMARLADHARRNGVSALVGDVLTENRRMIVLMRGLGASARAPRWAATGARGFRFEQKRD